MDVVGRSTVHVGDDFLLVGASDNGESAPMLKWDSRNSEWIELEVRKGMNRINEQWRQNVFYCRPNPGRRLGHLWSSAVSAKLNNWTTLINI